MKLNEILGIEYPFIQGGMANIATGEFAAAVSAAGGLGLIAAGGMSPDTLRSEIRKCRGLTDKPFGVNIMLMHPQADEIADIVIQENVKIVTTGAGNPASYIDGWKKAGIKIFPVVPSVGLARRMEKYGADGVIAEGTESGGHVGELTTMALVPQVAGAVSIPVIAAGGIASGKQILAAAALGACGVQMGTVFLASEECPIHENYKMAVIKAGDIDTVVTGRTTGAPVRVIKNQMAREYIKMESQALPRDELEKLTLGSLRRAVYDGDIKTGSLMAGQDCGMINSIRPVRRILEDLYSEYEEELKRVVADRL